ncbi:MAG: hypothetical protein HOV81_42005 [Kofleriaceae bacterium]|nr:hypothetical protein [Kofleriaceae bacterium]
MSPRQLYGRLKADFDRLEQSNAQRGEWLQLSYRLIETTMACQELVIEKQKVLLAYARGEADAEAFRDARQESRDAIQVLDKLAELHQQIRWHLLS